VATDFTVNLPAVAGQGRMTISMWGYYDTYHDVEILVNGVFANIANWSGISFHEVALDGIDLLEGDNTITLICNQGMDAAIVDWIEITYPRMFEASNNTLKFSHDSGYRYQINNFDAGNPVAFDITQATDPARVVNVEVSGTNPYTLEFEPPVNPGMTETYLLLPSDAGRVPVGLIVQPTQQTIFSSPTGIWAGMPTAMPTRGSMIWWPCARTRGCASKWSMCRISLMSSATG
jgi:hypothetical protein